MKHEQLTLFDTNYPDFKITKPVRLIELFAGYGSQALALKYMGVKFEHWKICEWAINSIQAYRDLHFSSNAISNDTHTHTQIVDYLTEVGISRDYSNPLTRSQIERLGEKKCRQIFDNIITTHNLVNVTKVKASDLEIVDTDKYQYIMTYSYPCFTADSLILTKDGYKKICDIKIGDLVLSHDNKYHRVKNVFNNGFHNIYKINAMGVDEIKTTANHRFYVREKYHKGHKWTRYFRAPKWKELKDLTSDDYLGIAINQECRAVVSNKLPTQNEHFWWIVGRYLGDGWIKRQHGIIICCGKNDELKEITYHLDKLDWNYTIVEERTVYKIHISRRALSDYFSQFGCGAGNKHLTQDILDLPIWHLEPFIKGYISADGCFTNGLYKAASISRELIYGIAQCVAKVYKTPYRIYKVTPPKTKIIENRLVNQNTWYQLVFKTEKRKQDKAFYENGYIWYPIKAIEYIGNNNVYDIEVEDSHSFTVQNTIVHNCQDLSLAGKQLGMEKGSGTRSGLLWEVERILDELVAQLNSGEELPILLMENVPQVHSKKNINSFNQWLAKLESLGYTNFVQDINSKDYGLPQSRNRTFCLSIPHKGINYKFLPKIELKTTLFDLLEPNVDEKLYLSEKQIQDILNWNALQKPLDTCERTMQLKYAPTLTTRSGAYTSSMILIKQPGDNAIRRLTPKEFFRLMGVKDEDFEKIRINQTNDSLYHLAGDSIATNSLVAVLKNLFI